MMTLSSTQLYDLIKDHLGTPTAESLTNYIETSVSTKVETRVKSEVEANIKALVTKTEMISFMKWMVGIWIVVVTLVIGSYFKLEAKMDKKFDNVDEKFQKMDEKFDKTNEKFDKKFDQMNERIVNIEKNLILINQKLDKR